MITHGDPAQASKGLAVAGVVAQKTSGKQAQYQFDDKRKSTIAQRKLQSLVYNSTQLMQMGSLQAVVQRMYEDAEEEIEPILDWITQEFDNDDRAKEISQITALDEVTKKQLKQVLVWVKEFKDGAATPLLTAYKQGNHEFTQALLRLIANPPQKSESELAAASSAASHLIPFDKLIREAVAFHAPRVGALIDAAKARTLKSRKELLVIVGEKHDTPYCRVMLTALLGALKRLGANRLYIEATPDGVRNHVAPFKETAPKIDGKEADPHKQHFFHHLYQQTDEVIGVDIYKDTVHDAIIDKIGPEPGTEDERRPWKARYMDLNLEMRNKGIAEQVSAQRKPGVLMVGLSHLPGLVSDESILANFEIVTIAAATPSFVEFVDTIAYGVYRESTKALKRMENVYDGANESDVEEIDASQAFALAEEMIVELNQI